MSFAGLQSTIVTIDMQIISTPRFNVGVTRRGDAAPTQLPELVDVANQDGPLKDALNELMGARPFMEICIHVGRNGTPSLFERY